MTSPTTYEIVIRGRASARFLQPMLHDFAVDHTAAGVTRLVGEVRDAAHLHGIVAHLTSVNAELVSIAPMTDRPSTNHPATNTESSNQP
ncbi:MAG: hypothetical protein JWM34_1977 [Ilumatobacteraceae bacterium]|nr:hypothetical protein [Ilumatobacteraceae bacterium]